MKKRCASKPWRSAQRIETRQTEVIGMKTSPILVAAIVVMLGSAPVMAQQVDASSSDDENAKTTYAPAPAGFGDEAQSRSWEMSQVTGNLDGKLDSKTAKVGDRVVLKLADKVQTPDGTILPRGSRLVGQVTQVQAHDNDRAVAQIAIAFDRAEMKNGQSIPVHTLIRTVRPIGSVTGMSALDSDSTMSADTMGGGRMGGSRSGGVFGGGAGAGGGATTGAGGMGNGTVGGVGRDTVDRTSGTVDSTTTGVGTGSGVGAGAGANENGEVQLAGHGDAPISGGAHAAAQQRSVPRPTGIPGVMLAGSSTASGLLIEADRKDLEFASGTRFEVGVVADR
jgi:hypothetical protein